MIIDTALYHFSSLEQFLVIWMPLITFLITLKNDLVFTLQSVI